MDSVIRFTNFVGLFASESMLLSVVLVYQGSFEVVLKPSKV